MGDSTIWLAFQGIPQAAVLDRLQLQPATEPELEIFGAALPDHWHLVLGQGLNFMDDAIMNRVCADCFGVSCFLDSRVMVSAAAGWENGRRVWSALHDSEQGIDHLETEGELPPVFMGICDALVAKQKAQGDRPRVDYLFDIPIELAAAITGFHHDRGTTIGYPDFELLELAVQPSLPTEPWLQPPRAQSWFTGYFG